MKPPIFALRPMVALAAAALTFAAQGAPAQPAPSIDIGPYFSGTVRGKASDDAIAMKGITVKLGPEQRAYVCYDTDLMRPSLAWTGEFLEFGETQIKIAWPPPPKVKGEPVFGTKAGPGWASPSGDWTDPRPNGQGRLPSNWAKYRGLYLHDGQVVLSYTVGESDVLELPGYDQDSGVFTRTIQMKGGKRPFKIALCEVPSGNGEARSIDGLSGGVLGLVTGTGTNRLAVAVAGAPRGAKILAGDQMTLELPASGGNWRFSIAVRRVSDDGELAQFAKFVSRGPKSRDLKALTKPGAARWKEVVTTKGTVGTGSGPYLVDTIAEPVNNPWNARTFFGGFDFLPDGRAAICTFHGDVWLVSGIDDTLEKVTWKRFATGLFQPLGLKVVNGHIYVLGRDQITRLHDNNNDGEADFYECFNNDTIVTANYHEFCLDLHTDTDGNFYFAKGAPWPPQVESIHQGTMIKVSRDGSRMDVIATGLRAPNGMTVGPNNEITVSDNQGHWMPSSKLNWVKPGGFYGMVQTAHRTPEPTDFDKPLCWLPMNMDNSSGGQVWVTSDKWGPLKGHLLFMSYGKCTLFHVMTEQVDGQMQGGMVQFPLRFQSGIMRGRFNPRDGQLYLAGLRGWQSSATRDGGFYRVRYNGQPVHMPYELHATKAGIEITFTSALDAVSAANADNYSLERWNYKWSGDYGSPEFSVTDPARKAHDRLDVKSVHLSNDRKTVFLEVPDMRPADQVKIKFSIDAADGTDISQEIYQTIYRLGDSKQLSVK